MSADLPTDFEAVEHAQAWLDYWRPRPLSGLLDPGDSK